MAIHKHEENLQRNANQGSRSQITVTQRRRSGELMAQFKKFIIFARIIGAVLTVATVAEVCGLFLHCVFYVFHYD